MSLGDVFSCLLEEGKTSAAAQGPREIHRFSLQLQADMPLEYPRQAAREADHPKTR